MSFHNILFITLQDRWKLLCSICGVPYGACIQVVVVELLFRAPYGFYYSLFIHKYKKISPYFMDVVYSHHYLFFY